METAIREGTSPERDMVQDRLPSWLLGAVACLGLLNVVVLLVQIPALIRSAYANADNAAALVLPALAGRAPAGSVIYSGNHAWYEPWWFMRLTAGLGGYRQLWELAPFFFGLLAIAVVSACTWLALGRLAGLVCATALLATSEYVRGMLYVPESHAPVVLHLGVFCGALLIVHHMFGHRSPRASRLLLLGAPVAVFNAAGVTDLLVLLSGLVPFVLAPFVCWLRSKSNAWRITSLFALTTGAVSVGMAVVLTHVMKHDEHLAQTSFPVTFVQSTHVLSNLQSLVVGVTELGGGDFFGEPVSGTKLLTYVAGVLALVALAATVRSLWRRVRAPYAPPAGADAPLSELHVAYWGLVLAVVLPTFALTSLAEQGVSARYMIGAWVAVAALLGTLATTRATGTALLVGVALFAALNARSELATGPIGSSGPNQRTAGEVERFVRGYGATIGYTGYWDSHPLTWETHLRIKAFPILPCLTGVCEFDSLGIRSWYEPRPGVRSFLITDSRPNIPLTVVAPPEDLGPPLAQKTVGRVYTVYVYNHDLAADLHG